MGPDASDKASNPNNPENSQNMDRTRDKERNNNGPDLYTCTDSASDKT